MKPSTQTRRIISELGLRYRPASTSDLQAHAATLALLAVDVADVPVHLLRKAVESLVKSSKFMPKAAELIEAAQALLDGSPEGRTHRLEDHVERLNAQRFVRDSGFLYFINSDGAERFIDRQGQ